MRRGLFLQVIDADNLVVGTASQPAAIGAKPDRMDSATVVAHMAQLFRARVICIRGIADSLHAPDAHMAIARRRRDAAAIGRDVAGVDLEVLLLAWTTVSTFALCIGASGKPGLGGGKYRCASARPVV